MSWCPKCKCEYREGFTTCSDCGCKLVEVLEPEKAEEIIEEDAPAFLVSVSEDFDAKIIESKLNAFGIPSFKKTDGLNGIYGFTGTSGIDIYVPSKLLEDARDLINIQVK